MSQRPVAKASSMRSCLSFLVAHAPRGFFKVVGSSSAIGSTICSLVCCIVDSVVLLVGRHDDLSLMVARKDSCDASDALLASSIRLTTGGRKKKGSGDGISMPYVPLRSHPSPWASSSGERWSMPGLICNKVWRRHYRWLISEGQDPSREAGCVEHRTTDENGWTVEWSAHHLQLSVCDEP